MSERSTEGSRTVEDVLLYNRTKLPDDVVRPLLELAMELSGAAGKIVVKVDARGRNTSYAVEAPMVDEGFLHDRRWKRGAKADRARIVRRFGRTSREDATMIATNGGYTVIHIGDRGAPIHTAHSFFRVAIHEFAHVRDFQQGAPFCYYAPGSTRKLPWRKRPHEIRAENAVFAALEVIERSRQLRRRVKLLITNLANALSVAYPQRSERDRFIERNRRFHYRYCKSENCNCWYGHYQRERAASSAAITANDA